MAMESKTEYPSALNCAQPDMHRKGCRCSPVNKYDDVSGIPSRLPTQAEFEEAFSTQCGYLVQRPHYHKPKEQ